MEDKITAIYELREAAERHARLEAAVGDDATVAQRHALLDARLSLEEQTQRAIEACEHCGREHIDDEGDCSSQRGKVIKADFEHGKKIEPQPDPESDEPKT